MKNTFPILPGYTEHCVKNALDLHYTAFSKNFNNDMCTILVFFLYSVLVRPEKGRNIVYIRLS